jgi:hypothetical protein
MLRERTDHEIRPSVHGPTAFLEPLRQVVDALDPGPRLACAVIEHSIQEVRIKPTVAQLRNKASSHRVEPKVTPAACRSYTPKQPEPSAEDVAIHSGPETLSLPRPQLRGA